MKKNNAFFLIMLMSLSLIGCGGNKEKTGNVDSEDWDAAFGSNLTENLTSQLHMVYEQTTSDGIYIKNATDEKDMMDPGKLSVSQSIESIVVLDPEKITDMDEDDIASYVAYLEDYGYVSTLSEDGVYTLNSVTETGGFCRENDNLTHFEYVYDDEECRYEMITSLYSLATMITNNIYTFADFYLPFDYFAYDKETDCYVADADFLASVLSESLGTELDQADMRVAFSEAKTIDSLSISYAAGSQSMSYSFAFSDYGTTEVVLPSDPYVCNHQGYDTDIDYDKNYHFDVCENCGSVMNVTAHTFDSEGCCTICGAQPATTYILDFGEGYDDHVTISVSDVTGLTIGVQLSDFENSSYDVDSETGTITLTYTCDNCPLKVVVVYCYVKDENCTATATYTYSFYDGDDQLLMKPIVITLLFEDHDYETVYTSLGDCKYRKTVTCKDCGDTYFIDYYNHMFETVSYDGESETGTVHCPDCGKTYTADRLVNSDYDDREHEFYIIFTEDGLTYAQYYYGVHEDDGTGHCVWCGVKITVLPYLASKCTEALYDYHIYLEYDADHNLLDYYFSDFEEEEGENPDYYQDGVFTCDTCNMRVEYYTTCEGQCTKTYVTTYKIYKNDVLLGTFTYTQIIGPDHTWGTPVVTIDGCLVTRHYTCVYCGATSEDSYYDHEIVKTCTVDADGTHHVHEECSKCHGEQQDYTVAGHDYQNTGYFEHDNHCIEIKRLKCQYCQDVAAETFGTEGLWHFDTTDKVIAEGTSHGDLTITYCPDCGDCRNYAFSESANPTVSKTGTVTTLDYGDVTVSKDVQTVSYQGNDCVKAIFVTIVIIYNGNEIYRNTYLNGWKVSHTADCQKQETENLGTYGGYAVYRHGCGFIEFVAI